MIILVSTSFAQINTVIGEYNSKVDGEFFRNQANVRPFVGTFRFEKPPIPLEPVKVYFTLEVSRDMQIQKGDWTIKTIYEAKAVSLLSDSIFSWAEPHTMGTQYSSYLEIVPLISGIQEFSLYKHDEPDAALSVAWCIDYDGNLTYLGKGENTPDCNRLQCTFFNNDSVYVAKRNPAEIMLELFDYNIKVKHTFFVGDTSTVTWNLVAVKDISTGIDIEYAADHFEIVSAPMSLPSSISRGDSLFLELKLVPLPVKDVHSIILVLENSTEVIGERKSQAVALNAVFENDSTLRFIADDAFYFFDDESLLPVFFPKAYSGTHERIHISAGTGEVKRMKF